MTSLPANVSVCGVKGHFAFARLAAGDPDGVMDLVPVVGLVVTLTPSPKFLLNVTASPPTVIIPEPMVLTTDSNGDLRDVDSNAIAYVIASDDADLNPTGFTYTVAFSGVGADKFTSFSAGFPAGQTLDIALLTPVSTALGTSVSVAQAAAAAAAASATAAAASAAAAASSGGSLPSGSNDDVLQRKAGAWTNRTPAQLKTDLQLSNVDNTADAAKPVSTPQAQYIAQAVAGAGGGGGNQASVETYTGDATLGTTVANVVEMFPASGTLAQLTIPGGIAPNTVFEVYQGNEIPTKVVPGPGAALSLAAPATGYTTPGPKGSLLCRTRAGAGAMPTTNLLARWRADDLTGANGSAVSSWVESSGNGLPAATQATSANQPTILVNAGGSGHKAVLFDGVNDFLVLSGLALALAQARSALTIFIAMALTTPLTSGTRTALALSPNGTSAASRLAVGPRETSQGRPYAAGRRADTDSLQQVVGSAAISTAQNCMLTATFNWGAAQLTLRKDGTQVGQSNAFQSAGSTPNTASLAGTIGANAAAGGEFFLGGIFDIAVFGDADTSGVLRANVGAAFAQYAITASDAAAALEVVVGNGVA